MTSPDRQMKRRMLMGRQFALPSTLGVAEAARRRIVKQCAIEAQLPDELRMDSDCEDSFVYFIRCGNLVKIGYADDVKKRLSNLNTGNPKKLELLFYTRGARPLEEYFHDLFADDSVRGEWFMFSKHIRCFLAARPYEAADMSREIVF